MTLFSKEFLFLVTVVIEPVDDWVKESSQLILEHTSPERQMPVIIGKDGHGGPVNVSDVTDEPTNLDPVHCPAVNSEIVVLEEEGWPVCELEFRVPHEDLALSEDDLFYFTWDVNHSYILIIV